jgi:ribosomal protein L37AE/L43A
MVLTKRTSNLPLICQICGDTARGINFDVMTCMSCKAFFRRHALQPAVSFKQNLKKKISVVLFN